MSFTAKDVASLRATTGAGMMDCKKALEENGGDIEAAKQWLREKGLAASAKRDDRDNAQGLVSIVQGRRARWSGGSGHEFCRSRGRTDAGRRLRTPPLSWT